MKIRENDNETRVKSLIEILIPVPPLDIQKKFVNLIIKLNEVKAHQTAQEAFPCDVG